jgi:hypothetical protein
MIHAGFSDDPPGEGRLDLALTVVQNWTALLKK